MLRLNFATIISTEASTYKSWDRLIISGAEATCAYLLRVSGRLANHVGDSFASGGTSKRRNS